MEQHRKQRKSYWLESVIGVCGLVLMFAGSQKGFAQQTATKSALTPASSAFMSVPFSALLPGAAQAEAKPRATAGEVEEESAKPSKPGGEGIKVHGHWIMDVKNPDGTLVRHLDFHNSLVTVGITLSGDQLLGALLSGNITLSDPAIAFVPPTYVASGADAPQYCNFQLFNPTACPVLTTPQSLYSSTGTGQFAPIFAPQTGLRAVITFSPTVNWVLTGNFTVPSGLTSISVVQTLLPACVPVSSAIYLNYFSNDQLTGSYDDRIADISPSACKAGANTGPEGAMFFPFTSTTVPNAPMGVTPGQVITVTVTLTFS